MEIRMNEKTYDYMIQKGLSFVVRVTLSACG